MNEKKEFVFFLNYLDDRYDKRIKEFISYGYEVNVYAFMQGDDTIDKYKGYKINKILYFEKNPSYFKRFFYYTPHILEIIKKYQKDKSVFYFFSLNIAISSLFFRRLNYIYEESDMLFDRVRYKLLRKVIITINKKIIRKSSQTVFTSEGFSKFYFGEINPENVSFIPNKVSVECFDLPTKQKEIIDFNKLRFGFVGAVRYNCLFNFAKVLIKNFPNFEFHFYGKNNFFYEEQVDNLKKIGNIYFHGAFKAPIDFPEIYSNINFVVATYDVNGVNPRYAEPNKLYESIFFRTPIIVSSNSFLSEKVEKLNIGFSLDPWDEKDIIDKISIINREKYKSYLEALERIPKNEAVNSNEDFFKKISQI